MRLDDNWQEWRFPQLVEALRKWFERNPGRRDKGRHPLLQGKQECGKHRGFVFCKSEEYKSVDCDKIKGVADRIRYLSDNKLCFNCTGTIDSAAHKESYQRMQWVQEIPS